ncbi:MAG TPA: L,D-transpeptidase family protein [Gaiellaceae bacterium]|nr:L,D-transpeptidase family protein [Gaiellaceae bacterium]
MRTALVLALGFLLYAAPPAAARRQASGCPATLANRLSSTKSAKQLVTVVSDRRTSTQAQLQLWRRAGDDCWRPVAGPWSAWVGRRGVSARKREGDRTTPAGSFGFGRVMYGVAADPGVRYRYHRIVCGDWWVEDPRSPSYNRFRHVPCGSQPPFRTVSEDLSRSPTAYRHFAVIDFNASPVVPGRGSGIFLHASTGRPTLGCVSLPLGRLLRVLRWMHPAGEPWIVIGTRADLARL